MATHPLPHELAYQAETTNGTDPGSWAASGQPLYHDAASVDLSGVGREMVEDPRNVDDIFDVHNKLHGLYAGSFPFSLPMHGTGTVTTATNQVTQTEHGKLLTHCLGGDSRTYSTVVAAGSYTTTTFDPTLTTGVDEGVWLGIADSTDANRVFLVQVASWDGSTVTTNVVLPFTPAAGDVISGVECNYVDSTALVDGGDTDTRAWIVQRGLSSSKLCYLFTGCKGELSSITLTRGAPAMLGFNNHYSNFKGPDDQAEVVLATAAGLSAPAIVGGDAQLWMENDGTTTRTVHKVNEMTFTPGVPVMPQATVTTPDANTPGQSGWSTGPADTMATFNIIPEASSWWDDYQADTNQSFLYQNVGSAGNVFGIFAPRAQIVETPRRGTADQVSTTSLSLRCRRDAANAAAGTAQLWQSKFCILRA
jgi:hypothetical protein